MDIDVGLNVCFWQIVGVEEWETYLIKQSQYLE